MLCAVVPQVISIIKEDNTHQPPHVVYSVREKEIHRPLLGFWRKGSKHENARPQWNKRLPWMAFYGDGCCHKRYKINKKDTKASNFFTFLST